MTTPVIIDIAAAFILFGSAALGAKRGLFKAISGLMITIVSLVGASIIAAALAPPAAHLAAPVIRGQIETRVEAALADRAHSTAGDELEGLLDALGLDVKLRSVLEESAQEAIRETGATVLDAVVEGMVRSVAHGILYILSFIILSVLLNLAARAMNLVLKLPGLHGINALGGLLAGLLQGILLLTLAILVLRQLGTPLMDPPWSETILSRILSAL